VKKYILHTNSTKNIADYFCEIQEINNITNNKTIYKTINETTKYLANFKFYFTNFINIGEVLFEILAVSFGAISFFFYEYFSLMIIKYLSPIHLMYTIPLFYSMKKIILTIYVSLSKDKDKIIIYSNEIFKAKFILDSIGDIFCIISNLIYLEILELNFCNLNYNLKKAIIKRGLLDSFKDDKIGLFNIFKLTYKLVYINFFIILSSFSVVEYDEQKQGENINEDIKNTTVNELSYQK